MYEHDRRLISGVYRGNKLRLLSGAGSVFLGLGLVLYPQIEKMLLDSKQKKLIAAFEMIGEKNSTTITSSTAGGGKDTSLEDGIRGVILIPRIDAAIPIFEGADEKSLSLGVSMIEPEKQFGVHNVGIAGHRAFAYGKQFNRLDELSVNDEIEIKTQQGNYKFVVDQTLIVDRTEVEVLRDKSNPYITLVTCTPIGEENPKKRLIVQAKLKVNGIKKTELNGMKRGNDEKKI
jgi:sortase A